MLVLEERLRSLRESQVLTIIETITTSSTLAQLLRCAAGSSFMMRGSRNALHDIAARLRGALEAAQTSVQKRKIGRTREVWWVGVQCIARYEVHDSDDMSHGAGERASGKVKKSEEYV